jgi:hypothetical protein
MKSYCVQIDVLGRMGCCSSKAPRSDDDRHVGLKTIKDDTGNEKENPNFEPEVQKDDEVMKEYIDQEKRGSCMLQVCCCGGFFDSCFDCCKTCGQLAVLHGHHPRELAHRKPWAMGFEEAKKEVEEGNGCFHFTCFGCCPITAIIKGAIFSSCYAKKMRLLALGVDAEKTDMWFGSFCCCGEQDLKEYECCQGYQDNFFLKPAKYCKCFTSNCPELSLNMEVWLFPGSSMDGTVQYLMDTRDVKPDPAFAKFNAFIHELENLKSSIEHIGSSFPAAKIGTQPLSRTISLYANCLKKSEIAIVALQVEKHVQQEAFYVPNLKGRHQTDNTLTKMAHRVVNKKSYIVKVPKKYFVPGMRNDPLECKYPELPAQQKMTGELCTPE